MERKVTGIIYRACTLTLHEAFWWVDNIMYACGVARYRFKVALQIKVLQVLEDLDLIKCQAKDRVLKWCRSEWSGFH